MIRRETAMNDERIGSKTIEDVWNSLSPEALDELRALGLRGPTWSQGMEMRGIAREPGSALVPKRPIQAPNVLNEAYSYAKPSSFSRGMRVELPGATMLLLSGTASVNENGKAAHLGDFRAQVLRTYRNLTELLAAERATWHDVVRTTCYLRDIERDYAAFNEIRTLFFREIGLESLPASTGIQAILCWPELLVEMEAMAILPKERV